MISFALDDDQQIIRDTVHRFAADVIRPGARAWETAGAVPAPVHGTFFELGLGLLDAGEVEKDQGHSLLTAILVHEELAWGDAGAAVALWGPHAAGHALFCLGDGQQARRVLAPFAQSDGALRRGALAFSEKRLPEARGDGAVLGTTALPCPGGYLLSGEKCFVINAAEADLTVVFAQLGSGPAAFAVSGRPAREGSFRTGEGHQLLGLLPAQAGTLIFLDHFVPEQDRLLGGGHFAEAVAALFARLQLVSAARQVGLMRAAYEFALDYTQERKAFGKPVAHFQSIAFTLADMLMDVESARWMVWRAASAVDQGNLCPADCAQAAVQANEGAFRVADSGVQLLGGAGYIRDFPAEKWLRDTKALSLLHGTDALHGEVIAVAELSHPLREGGPLSALLGQATIQPLLT